MDLLSAIAYLKAEPDSQSGPGQVVAEDEFPAFFDLGNGLSVYYLLDLGDRFEYVQRKDLIAQGLTVEAVHEAAVSNLSALCRGQLQIAEYGDIHAVTVDGCFEASTLLLDRLWEDALKDTVSEGFLVAIPARDVLAYCDAGSSQGISELRAVVARTWPDGDHLLTQTLYKRTGHGWRPYHN